MTTQPTHSTYQNHFRFSFSDPAETDILLLSVEDSRTGYVVRTALANPGVETASIMAFAGARFSRSALSSEDIFKEVAERGGKAQERLASIFRNYGHASVADMAQLFAYIEQVPQVHAFRFFYETSVGGGQERSTRYQAFGGVKPVALETLLPFLNATEKLSASALSRSLLELQARSLELYEKWTARLTERYTEVYQVSKESKKESTSLTARVFDSARSFLLSGLSNKTSLAWISSAREWARIIGVFKASPDFSLRCLAEQLEAVFAPEESFAREIDYTPEAPGLIRYTSADETIQTTRAALQRFLEDHHFPESVWSAALTDRRPFTPTHASLLSSSLTAGEKVALQHILSLYPSVAIDNGVQWLRNLSEGGQSELSQVLFQHFTHHRQLGNAGRVNELSFQLAISLGEARDLNRHRAWGRYSPFLEAEDGIGSLLADGFTLPLYLTENPALATERFAFEEDLHSLYSKVSEVINQAEALEWFPPTLLLQCFPFAHTIRYFMHGSPKELSYMTQLRARPGGHINYRAVVSQMAAAAAASDPLLSGLLLRGDPPNPSSRDEFLDRS